MTIKYKFNKSSEARDCVVENVEIEIKERNVLKAYTTTTTKGWSAYEAFITETEKTSLIKTKQFTSPQELKDYINTIQEPIEFIAESSIDDVLMKEWIGEWNTELRTIDIPKFVGESHLDCSCCDWYEIEVKAGSPKLNNNWTFKLN